MSSLNVICLISGGKDSLYSILHCMRNGHKIVALANLHPPTNGVHDAVEDLDSYMYQTIGHAVIPLYEQALGLPLYRQEIHGSAVNQDRCYGPNAEDDETEALVPLLRTIQSHHAEVNAVSTGAILSDYQRTRVESVAVRLGLTPLSYLWQYPNLPPHTQTSLLEHMAAVGQDSRIVKVASGGLDDSFLWQDVASHRTIARLETATKRFGSTHDGAVLGEGGEYETLALSGPSCLWKSRITINKSETKVVAGDGGSASIRIADAHLSANQTTLKSLDTLDIPALLEPRFQAILDASFQADADRGAVAHEAAGAQNDALPLNSPIDQSSHFLANITGDGSTAAEEMQSIMEKALNLLGESGHAAQDVVCTSIILRNMADFTAINPVYSTYFRHPNPPARVTIACAGVLPSNKQVMVSLTVSCTSEERLRNGLHVQSRSYWAPANIGPYSQAITTPLTASKSSDTASLVYIAGQIPLLPATMDLAGSGMTDERACFTLQAALALQHTIRVARAMHVRQWVGAIAFIAAENAEIGGSRATTARHTWNAVHQPDDSGNSDMEAEDADLWEMRFGVNRTLGVSAEQSKYPGMVTPRACALYVICVDALPRNAAIEWVVYGATTEVDEPLRIPQHGQFLKTFAQNLIPAR